MATEHLRLRGRRTDIDSLLSDMRREFPGCDFQVEALPPQALDNSSRKYREPFIAEVVLGLSIHIVGSMVYERVRDYIHEHAKKRNIAISEEESDGVAQHQ